MLVSSEGDVMPSHFFKNKETVTKEVYVNVLASSEAMENCCV